MDSAAGMQKLQSVLDRLFGLSTSGSSLRTEFVAGLTTFLTMVYIVFVNPDILGNAGMDKGAAVFFAPLAGMVPAYASSAALLYVACFMACGLAEIEWDDITEAAPAVVAAITMPLTYSIATGIGLGFITYAVTKLVAGKFADAKPAVLMLALIFAIKFAVG